MNNNQPTDLFYIENLQVRHQQRLLLNIDNLSIPSGKLVAIIGANGAGKSTLIHALLGQIQGCEITGSIHCLEMPMKTAVQAGKIAWVGQHEQFSVPLTLLDYVLLGTIPNLTWYQRPSQKNVANAQTFLTEFDLLALQDKRVQSLSGGEKQRVAMVRAFMQQTEVLLLDEPTNHLDIKHQRHLFAYLHNLHHHIQSQANNDNQKSGQNNQKNNKSIVTVLHNLTHAYNHAEHIIAMKDGQILAQGTPDEVMTAKNLQSMYGVTIHAYDTPDGRVFV